LYIQSSFSLTFRAGEGDDHCQPTCRYCIHLFDSLEILRVDSAVDIFYSVVALDSIRGELLEEEVEIDKVKVCDKLVHVSKEAISCEEKAYSRSSR
jgi:hypothetical protein